MAKYRVIEEVTRCEPSNFHIQRKHKIFGWVTIGKGSHYYIPYESFDAAADVIERWQCREVTGRKIHNVSRWT